MTFRSTAARFAGTLTAFALAAAPLRGQVINNGLPNGANGNEMTEWVQAEDFTLSGMTTLTAATFWAFGNNGSYQGSIVWQIFSNNGGVPGTSLFSGTVTPATSDYPGAICCGYDFGMQLDFALPSVMLSAGTYWFALHNGPLTTTTRSEFYWATTNGNGTATAEEDDAPFGDNGWSNNGQEHAFALYADTVVPEPGTMSLLALGLAGMAGATRRRRRKA